MPIRKLSVRRGGNPEGAPALFLHAGLGSARMWVPVWTHMQRFRLMAPNLPGHGGTGYNDWQDYQMQAVEDALSCLPQAPVHLVGHSFGATVALRLALRHPGRVRSLTLIEPVYFVFLHDAGDAMFAQHLEAVAPLGEAFAAGDMERAAALFLKMWNGVDLAELTPETRRVMTERMPLIRATEPEILRPETKWRLKLSDVAHLRPPTLLMLGSDTLPVIRRIHWALREVLPGAKIARVMEAGHMVPQDQPQRVAERLKGFWGRHAARG
ncbi:MAG: alpha/beta hydrolase [Pseudomonadota bacterium]